MDSDWSLVTRHSSLLFFMTPERWKQIETIYDAALKLDAERRSSFLDRACNGDLELRQEVAELLASDEQAGSFLAAPAVEVAAKGLAAEAAASLIGRQIGHYQILSLLGAGGMGEVYLARDSRLNRKVAVKVLPDVFARDQERMRRFEQEALATSALNHPNILTVYDIGEFEGGPFIVAELLEGEELRALLVPQSKAGPLPVRKALNYAQQVAQGLAAAHEKGVIHRDLKPENLFVTTDGRVKILDFGLAKLKATEDEAADSGVATRKQLTDPGTVMGTVGYMAPEQVRGQKTDHRADIFSFGAILYEMLAGKRAFNGASAADLMSAILKEEPPELGEAKSKISPALEKIVRRCLEKQPERRFQSASDLGFALEALSSTSSSSGAGRMAAALDATAPAERGGWREHIPWLVAGALGLALLALGVAYFNPSTTGARAVRLAFAPPENLAFDNGTVDYVIVSPDGQKLAFTGRSSDGKRQLWVRPLDSAEAQPLPGTDNALEPFWSPDSRSIGFITQGKLKRVDLEGGRPQTLCEYSGIPYGGTWNREGVILFAASGLYKVKDTGGAPELVRSTDQPRDAFVGNPWFLPDGRHFLFRVSSPRGRGGDQEVFVGSLDSNKVKLLLSEGSPAVYAPPGWVLFVRNGALLAQSFDVERLELKGDPIAITRPTNIVNVYSLPFSVSQTGVLVWQGSRHRDYQLVWFDRAGKQIGAIGSPIKATTGSYPRFSPDGKQVAINRIELQSRNMDIWLIDLARDLPTRLTSDPGFEWFPTWSPDGGRIVFRASKAGVNGLYQKAANGAGAEELLLQVDGASAYDPNDWSPDGRFLLYNSRMPRNVWALPLNGSDKPYPLLNSEFDEYQAQLSPDGRWLAYASNESGNYEIYAQAFSLSGSNAGKLSGNKLRISTGGGNQPRWRRDGQELFYVATDGMMMAVKINGATFGTPQALFKTRMMTWLMQSGIDYDVTADGQRFLIGTLVGEPPPVSIILNWTAGVK